MSLPLPLYSAAQVRELDRHAIEKYGIAGAELMARAGARVFETLCTRFPRARRVIVVCGAGNNGGDGFVVAEVAKRSRLEPTVLTLGSKAAAGDAAFVRMRCEMAGVAIQPFAAAPLHDADVVVDALLGTGLQRDVEGEWRAAIDAINASGRPVVAVDIPSGLNADTGAVMGAAVRADITVSFIGLKPGLFLADGRDHAGEIIFDDLGVPPEVYSGVNSPLQRLAAAELCRLVRPRRRNAHKGDFGHVLVIGGGPGMPGAARLCGEAALRVGAGLVTLATHPSHAAAASAARPELLAFAVRTSRDLEPLIDRAGVIALGPGLSKTSWARNLWRAALRAKLPLIVDADALNLLAAAAGRRDDWVLTPHPGEAARLLKTTTAAVQRDRVSAAKQLVERYGGVCVLKGAGTLIAARGAMGLCDAGNPGMASGGMGDVLTGVIAALRAQGLSAVNAARLGVWLHAAAGDGAAGAGEAGLIASDLFPHLRRRLDELVHDDARVRDRE
jgi:ADP-dependent NAD(P)H-hydrate dehydratase / NAD(P)H-hydrate epimerase